jgi:hypothetical protein
MLFCVRDYENCLEIEKASKINDIDIAIFSISISTVYKDQIGNRRPWAFQRGGDLQWRGKLAAGLLCKRAQQHCSLAFAARRVAGGARPARAALHLQPLCARARLRLRLRSMPPQLEPWPLQHSLLDAHAAAHSSTCLTLPPECCAAPRWSPQRDALPDLQRV